jgi:hypothetical protein
MRGTFPRPPSLSSRHHSSFRSEDRMSSPLWRIFAACAAALLVTAGTVSAQVCGDADNSGTVTVTDGVQTLRAAAALSSTCSAGTCDVDGSGAITVTDGVNVLRKAAGVAITENCPGSSLDAQVENLLGASLPVFGNLTKLGSAAHAAAVQTLECDNVGGSASFDDETGEFVFDDCDSAGFNYDGSLVLGENTLDFNINFTDLETGQSESLSGGISARAAGEAFVFDGFFQLASNFGEFSVSFDSLQSDPETGAFIGGSLQFSIDDGQLAQVDNIRLTFDPSNVAFVEVNLDDGSTLPFNYDVLTGDLTPISN